MKQTIDLMKPRYRVIADWPSLDEIVIGDIIEGEIFESESLFNTPMHDFPHLFKKLEWWEDRDESEMPEYVKANKGVMKFDIEQWNDWLAVTKSIFLPATETDYQNYLKSKS